MVEGYVKNIARLMGVEAEPYRWVIASVDIVREVAGGIEMVVKAVALILGSTSRSTDCGASTLKDKALPCGPYGLLGPRES
jgi:hypothetical protein